jgi:Uri superfamily endonuclease
MHQTDWPSKPGAYVLLLDINTPLEFIAGSLGRVTLLPGCYAYVGSARGPGGLRARLARHSHPTKKLHWHIDYLTRLAPVSHIHWAAATEPLECQWVQTLRGLPGAHMAAPGFGSSDCRNNCRSHLLRLPGGCGPAMLSAVLGEGAIQEHRQRQTSGK